MSIHNIPAGTDIVKAQGLMARYLRQPSGIVYGNGLSAEPTALEFTPNLTAQELNVLADIAAACRVEPAPTGRATDNTDIQNALAQLQAYINISSPTLAQTAPVVKLLCRGMIIIAKRVLGVG